MEKSEILLKKLRRLEANMKCPNCLTPAPRGIGFGNVCAKFNTFICDLCKTSHQAISHRVKSSSMSTWTIEEVMALSTDQNGGNEVALHVWLANAPPVGGKYPGGTRPKEGDKVEIFKQFITDCYEHKKFKASTPFSSSTPQPQSEQQNRPKVAVLESKSNSSRQVTSSQSHSSIASTNNQPKSIVTPVQEVDLLAFDSPAEQLSFSTDFGEFECGNSNDFGAFKSEPLTHSPTPTESSNSLLNFGEFTASLPSVPQVASTHSYSSTISVNDCFSNGQPALVTNNSFSVDSFAQTLHSSVTMPSSSTNLSNGQPVLTGSHCFSVDPFAQTLNSSTSMPNFTTQDKQFQTENLLQSQSQRSHVKSNHDLLSLFDQQPNQSLPVTLPSQTPLRMDNSNAISDMGNSRSNMMYSSGNSGYNQIQSSSSSMHPYNNAHGSSQQMGSNNMSDMGGPRGMEPQGNNNRGGNGYTNQQYQPQQQYQQTQPSQQVAYRGIATQQNIPKGPIDSFGFVESVITNQVQSNGMKSNLNGMGGSFTSFPPQPPNGSHTY